MRVYIASLSDYNNGRLEGKWFDLSDYLSASDLMDDIQEMLNDLTKKYKNVDGEVREEWAVHDYEGIPPTLASEYMGEADFEKLIEIRRVAEDRDIPVEVLVERAGDTGSDDYETLAESLVMVVDGYDETDIVYEIEDQLGDLGYDFWQNYIFISETDKRIMYGEDVDRFREDILSENPDLEEDEAERQAEEMADEEESRRNNDLIGYLEEMGLEGELPNWVMKDYNDAWKYALSYDYDVIHYDDQMYVFTNNYSVGGTILSGLVGAYIGYKIGRAKPQKKGFETEKKIGRKIKGAFSKNKYAEGGSIENLKRGDKITILGDTYEFLRLKNDNSQGYEEKLVVLYDVKDKAMKSFPLDMVEAYSKYAEGGGVGKLDSGVYRIGKPTKIAPNLYEQKIVQIFEDGEIATASDYGKKLSDFRSQKYPIITQQQLDNQSKFAKGGGVYSSDSMYELKVFDGKSNELLTTKRFRARNQREANELGQDYEYEMQQKYGDYLRFVVSEAKPLMARGGNVNEGGEVRNK